MMDTLLPFMLNDLAIKTLFGYIIVGQLGDENVETMEMMGLGGIHLVVYAELTLQTEVFVI